MSKKGNNKKSKIDNFRKNVFCVKNDDIKWGSELKEYDVGQNF